MSDQTIDQLVAALNADASFRAKFSAARSFEEAAALAQGRGCSVAAADLEAWAARGAGTAPGELSERELGAAAGGSKPRESSMTTVLTNIANMKHESLKGIAQNLRG